MDRKNTTGTDKVTEDSPTKAFDLELKLDSLTLLPVESLLGDPDSSNHEVQPLSPPKDPHQKRLDLWDEEIAQVKKEFGDAIQNHKNVDDEAFKFDSVSKPCASSMIAYSYDAQEFQNRIKALVMAFVTYNHFHDDILTFPAGILDTGNGLGNALKDTLDTEGFEFFRDVCVVDEDEPKFQYVWVQYKRKT